MKKRDKDNVLAWLLYLNTTYAKLHRRYEDLFWKSYMGDHSVNKEKDVAMKARDLFRMDELLKEKTAKFAELVTGEEKERLLQWNKFFSLYQVPSHVKKIKEAISKLETEIESARAMRKEGYIDPVTKKFTVASLNAISSLMRTSSDEKLRRACFIAQQTLAQTNVSSYLKLVALRNNFAQAVGFEDFYAYKLAVEEGMKKKDLFPLFNKIYQKTKYAFKNIRKLELQQKKGLRKPWNYGFMFAGSLTKEEDPYLPFEQALERWGRSFENMGINYKGGVLVLDLLDRKGKYNNGFCHWPEPVTYRNGAYTPGRSHFTCNVVLGRSGQANQGMVTLFHEGGHAAHLLNCRNKDICLNIEYPPASTAWDETQSMFLDSVYTSIEWKSRYAKTSSGDPYPFTLFEKRVKELSVLRPLDLMGIMMVCEFEKRVYEDKKLTSTKLLKIARETSKKYRDLSVSSIGLLEVPHIYSWESACSYHGYGLATMALTQWREYFERKYGYIVDNPQVGKEMERVWRYGAAKPFKEMVELATGEKLSADPFVRRVTATDKEVIEKAKKRIQLLSKKRTTQTKISLNATIKMVHGKQVIADNKKGFEAMVKKYASWLQTQYPKIAKTKDSK